MINSKIVNLLLIVALFLVLTNIAFGMEKYEGKQVEKSNEKEKKRDKNILDEFFDAFRSNRFDLIKEFVEKRMEDIHKALESVSCDERIYFIECCYNSGVWNVDDICDKKYGRTSLYYAYLRENERLVEFLLKKGAILISETEKDIEDLFFMAVERNRLEWVKRFVEEKHVNINALNIGLNTALQICSDLNYDGRNDEMIIYLVSVGADVNICYTGKSPLYWAEYYKNEKIIKLLKDKLLKQEILARNKKFEETEKIVEPVKKREETKNFFSGIVTFVNKKLLGMKEGFRKVKKEKKSEDCYSELDVLFN